MSDTPGSNPASSPATPPPPASAAPTSAVTEEGKLFAILSWALNIIGLPFWLVPVIQKNNEFALYHAKQAGFLWCGVFAFIVVVILLMFALALIAPSVAGALSCIVWPAWMVVCIGALIINILGLINAVNLKQVPVPIVGDMALNMLKGIQVKSGS